jgi:phenylalanine-4-hydroxylase
VLRTNYLIDAYQKTYFVLDDIEQLFDSVLEADFESLFAQAHLPRMRRMPACPKTSRSHRSQSHDAPRLR